MNKPYCYPGDIAGLVEVVGETPSRHRWLKGNASDSVGSEGGDTGVVISGLQRLHVGSVVKGR